MKTKFFFAAALVAMTISSCDLFDKEEANGHNTDAPYRIGDYYQVDSVRGVVYKVSDGGMHGMIVSLDELAGTNVSGVYPKTTTDNGLINMALIRTVAGWETGFPAVKWCADMNAGGDDGWYLPAIDELRDLYDAMQYVNLNAMLLEHYGTSMSIDKYISSTNVENGTTHRYEMWRYLDFQDGYNMNDYDNSNRSLRARAVHAF